MIRSRVCKNIYYKKVNLWNLISHTNCIRNLTSQCKKYDVIIVGGGHAGTEAAAASARMGCHTLLVTQKLETIGEMSCNPSFGGIGKGQLMREVDALDGVCCRICDKTGIFYRVLNRSKGAAVHGLRAQIDRKLYKKELQAELFNTPNLDIQAESVEDLLISNNSCVGVIFGNGTSVKSHSVVLTTGTFLRGQINIGLECYPAGRFGDKPAVGLAQTLEKSGFRLGRLKTGTPPRLDGRTIDYSQTERLLPDDPSQPFSFMNDSVWIKPEDQLNTFLTFTTPSVATIVLDNIHLNRHVKEEINGPRYCPSIESKILKFGNRSHQIWLEPEGLDTHVVYPGGLSCTMQADAQLKMLRGITGLENVEMIRPGYGVEYDYVDPRELNPSLETHKIKNLFFAGQINGTTGYEEAAAQGIIAGINAACCAQRKPPLHISRTEGYIGVLIDDLTTHGTNEPYRMFTSRAEFRLSLRPDNADIRLTQKGHEIGCVGQKRYEKFNQIKDDLDGITKALKSVSKTATQWFKETGINIANYANKKTGFDLLGCDNVTLSRLKSYIPENHIHALENRHIADRMKVEAIYAYFLENQRKEIEEVQKEENLHLPDDLDFYSLTGLKVEMAEKLAEARPVTIGAASRIPGITPAALLYLMRSVKKQANINI